MLAVQRRRQATVQAIARNPVKISLTRGENKEPDGAGGYRVTPGVLPPQTFRLHISGLGGTRNLSKEAGQVQITRPGLLARYDADVSKGDTFERDGKSYRIDRVNLIRFLGEVVSIQCEVEEVS